jgi:hypothetical protein
MKQESVKARYLQANHLFGVELHDSELEGVEME